MQTLIDRRKLFTKTNGPTSVVTRLLLFKISFITLYFCFTNIYLFLLSLSLNTLAMFTVCYFNFNDYSFVSTIRVVLINLAFDVVFCFLLISLIFALTNRFYLLIRLFIIVALLELRRTPFDIIERESELVSRYNIEYRRFRFTCLFLAEYLGFFWIVFLRSNLFRLKSISYLLLILFLILI